MTISDERLLEVLTKQRRYRSAFWGNLYWCPDCDTTSTSLRGAACGTSGWDIHEVIRQVGKRGLKELSKTGLMYWKLQKEK